MRSWKFYSAAVLSVLSLTSAVMAADEAPQPADKPAKPAMQGRRRGPQGGRFDRNVMMMSMLAKPELDAYLANKTPENLQKLEAALKAATEKQIKDFMTKVQAPDFKLPQMPGPGGRGRGRGRGRGQGRGGFPPSGN